MLDNNEKIQKLLKFYLLATELKNKIRSGWIVWNVSKERLESVAEHIYGTCILAIAIDSEFNLNIDLSKVVMMLVLHEIEEIKIGDLTLFDKITDDEKRIIGKEAVTQVLKPLSKKDKYIELIEEFENMQTKESIFAKMCDKLEADIQSKIYCEQGYCDMYAENVVHLLKDERIAKMINEGAKTVADLFIENDKLKFKEKTFEDIADFVKEMNLLELK